MTRRRSKRPRKPQPTPPPLIRELPPDERPRQRLLRAGTHSLSDPELFSILLGNGCRDVCNLNLAREILAESDGLFGLVGVRAEALRRRGLGEAKAASILASLELARRLAENQVPDREPMSRPHRVVRYLMLRYAIQDQEVMGVLYLDVRHRLLGEQEIFRGTLQRAAVEPRQILRPALHRGAAGIVLFHTHPSQNPDPSLEDLSFTRRLNQACDALGVQLVDHLILGTTSRWESLRSRGAF